MGAGPVNKNWVPGTVNINWRPGVVNRNWGPRRGAGSRAAIQDWESGNTKTQNIHFFEFP